MKKNVDRILLVIVLLIAIINNIYMFHITNVVVDNNSDIINNSVKLNVIKDDINTIKDSLNVITEKEDDIIFYMYLKDGNIKQLP